MISHQNNNPMSIFHQFLQIKHLEYYDAIAILAISAIVVQLTDMGSDQREELLHAVHSIPLSMMLIVTSVSPWIVPRLISQSRLVTSSLFANDDKNNKSDRLPVQVSSSQIRFNVHEGIHNLTALFHHSVPLSIFVWIAMINFPFWFAQIYRAVYEKEERASASNCQESGESDNVKEQHQHKNTFASAPKYHPLVIFSWIVYVLGVMVRGESYILSAAGIVTLALPLLRCHVDLAVAINLIPLGILFILEHYSITNELKSSQAFHIMGHFALHKAANDWYVHYFMHRTSASTSTPSRVTSWKKA